MTSSASLIQVFPKIMSQVPWISLWWSCHNKRVFSCEDAQQILMSVCRSVCLSFKLKFVHCVQICTVPECSRMFQNACRMFQNKCRMFQNKCSRKHTEYSRMHAEYTRMNVPECIQNVLECSKMNVPECMQNALECSRMNAQESIQNIPECTQNIPEWMFHNAFRMF